MQVERVVNADEQGRQCSWPAVRDERDVAHVDLVEQRMGDVPVVAGALGVAVRVVRAVWV